MVKGLDIFYEYFSEYSDLYVLIMEYHPELNKNSYLHSVDKMRMAI